MGYFEQDPQVLRYSKFGSQNKFGSNQPIPFSFLFKKDQMRFQRVHIYYCNQGSIWGLQPKHASWVVQRILKAQKYYEAAGWSEEDVVKMDNFSIKKLYLQLRGDHQKVEWRRLVCNNIASPKWIFIM